jgi:hypothetical protein
MNLSHQRDWPYLQHLIIQLGVQANCMSPSHDSGALMNCLHIAGGYVIAEDGSIYPPKDVIY